MTLITWARILIGGLSLGSALLASWIALGWWWQKRKIFFLLVSILLACAGFLIMLATYRFNTAWAGALVFCLAVGGVLSLIGTMHASLRVMLVSGAVGILLLSLSIPLLLVWTTEQQSYTHLHDQLVTAEGAIANAQLSLQKTATQLTDNASIGSTASNGVNEQYTADLNQLLISKQLNQLIITDKDGTVRTRAGDTAYNDSLVSTSPWFISALQGNSLNGITLTPSGEPSIVAIAPILKQGALMGGLLISQPLSKILTSTSLSSFAVATSHGVMSSSTASAAETSVYTTATVDTLVEQYATPNSTDENFFQFHVTTGSNRYRIVGVSKTTLNAGEPIVIITLDPDQNQHPAPLVLVLIAFLGSSILGALTAFGLKKIWHD